MQIETAELSLLGDRDENQDRVAICSADDAAILIVVDGMGGHAKGAKAAEIAVNVIVESFEETPHPIFDPQGFLHLTIGKAHDAVVELGKKMNIDMRPRATCSVCLIQDNKVFWVHVGDSRIYHLRKGKVIERTRDHSHVELLLQEGLITQEEAYNHPMRNYVECCLGGDAALPEMSVSNSKKLMDGDAILVCSDGFWSGLEEHEPGRLLSRDKRGLNASLKAMATDSIKEQSPYGDNATAAVAVWKE